MGERAIHARLESIGVGVSRYGLVVVLMLIGLLKFTPKASFVGSLGAVVTFLLTISFLFSTPGALQLGHGISILGDTGQFLIKDLVLLGASCWIAAEALSAVGGTINKSV